MAAAGDRPAKLVGDRDTLAAALTNEGNVTGMGDDAATPEAVEGLATPERCGGDVLGDVYVEEEVEEKCGSGSGNIVAAKCGRDRGEVNRPRSDGDLGRPARPERWCKVDLGVDDGSAVAEGGGRRRRRFGQQRCRHREES
jgi:hypothetical protein